MKNKIRVLLMIGLMAITVAACGNRGGDGKQGDTQAEDGGSEDTDKITYDVEECVKLGEYSALEVSVANSYEVTKEQVEESALSRAKSAMQPVYKDTDKKVVEDGDVVDIDYVGKKDGVAFDGGTASGHKLKIGSGDFIDGFEEGLIGTKVGETVDLDLTFPEQYPSEELAGAAVVFTVTVNKIVEEDTSVEFELTDEFVKENLNYDNVKEFKKSVRESLEATNDSSKVYDTRQAVILKLQEVCEVDMPEGLLEQRVDDYIRQFTEQNCQDVTLEEYLSSNFNGMKEEEFQSEITTEMDHNLKTELILGAIADKEGIELDEEGFQAYVQQQMSMYGYQNEEDYYASYGSDAKSGEDYQRNIYVCNKALDQVIENAKVTYGQDPE